MTGETAAAVAGGTNVMLTPQTSARICLLQALSPVGRCKTFDASGDGYGRGEAFTIAHMWYASTSAPLCTNSMLLSPGGRCFALSISRACGTERVVQDVCALTC